MARAVAIRGNSRKSSSANATAQKSPQTSSWVSTLFRRLNDPNDTLAACHVASALMLFESLLCTAILFKVPYTKIDWDAYMSQVEGFLGGERDYTKLEGDTGPLVYPAGFLYVFTALRWVTDGQVAKAQVIFLALYLLNQGLVLSLYIRAKVVPPWSLPLLSLSKRLHSIFLLRLFNDCFAMAFLHAALLLMQGSKWMMAMVLFSAAVSVKMNVLLFAPPLLILLLKALSLWRVLAALSIAAAVQALVGAPFLLTFPKEYISQAFNLGRVFIHFWSVNFKFVPESTFVSKPFALTLLGLHLGLLLLFANFQWCRFEDGIFGLLVKSFKKSFYPEKGSRAVQEVSPAHTLSLMWIGNFIGIVCARSLHYQFYCWYFHSLPLLLWLTPIPTLVKLGLFFTIEFCWNVYPSTPTSSMVLLVAHALILIGLAFTTVPRPLKDNVDKKKA